MLSITVLAGCESSHIDHGVLRLIPSPVANEAVYEDMGRTARAIPQRPVGRIDTRTLKGKREFILRCFIDSGGMTQPTYDSVLDLNYDGFEDYIIGSYGASGTGFKNGIDVFVFHRSSRRYVYDSLISSLRNPSFFLDRGRITGFYIGLGGGGGRMLEWRRGRWLVARDFSVSNRGSATEWTIHYPGSNCADSIVRAPFQMIPPDFILETDLHTLPY